MLRLSFSCIGFLLFFLIVKVEADVIEAPDGSVCFNNCNGHGDCVDYSCHCWPGYIGDDCGKTFADESNIVPILTAGHFNLSRENFTQIISKHPLILVGFSSYSCHKCILPEPEYLKISESLKDLVVPFGRADVDKMKTIAIESEATDLPALVLFNKRKPYLYKGFHNNASVTTYIKKRLSKPTIKLSSVNSVKDFIKSRKEPEYSVSTVMVVGFFSDHEGIEEDEYEDFLEIASEFHANEDIYFGEVTSSKTANWFKNNKTIDRTPSMLVIGDDDTIHTINLDELYGEPGGVRGWIQRHSIPLVGKMTSQNFQLYEKLGLPMLMMFLDLTDEMETSQPGKVVGGKSGEIFNEILLDEFKLVAKEHSERILFVYLDGTKYQDQMRAVGLYGGVERLPSLAFNTRDRTKVPFPEELPINKDTIMQYCANFITGKLKSSKDTEEMAKKALQSALPINKKNIPKRKKVKGAPEVVQGVSEQFGDGRVGDSAVKRVTLKNFDDIVMDEEKDVVLLLHAENCEKCSHFAVYFKRMSERIKELNLPHLVIARMDITNESPPAELNLIVGPLPILVMIPAGAKQPPWTFYSGIGKMQEMMKWVHQQSSYPFELPNLPHLSEKDKELYKQQVREREEMKARQREEDRLAMENEEKERKELERRKNKNKKLDDNELKTSLEDHDEF